MKTQENFQMVGSGQFKWQHLHLYGLSDILGVYKQYGNGYIDVV
jgi:hypothetical protein